MHCDLIYLDNAATTFPKPREVLDAMVERYALYGVSPGRGAYDLAVQVEDMVQRVRAKIAAFFGAPDPDRVVFTSNATDALNLAIQGVLRPHDHVITSQLDHNSVLRPLNHLSQSIGVQVDHVGFDEQGLVDPDEIASLMRPETRMVVLTHASNVLGTVQPVEAIGRLCKERGVAFVVDAAQSAGQVPVNMASMHASAIAFTGHKSLYGSSGTGGLVVHPDLEIHSTRFGGTGMDSRSPLHTQDFPFRLEAGTLNLMGIFGLEAGLDHLQSIGVAEIHRRERALLDRLVQGLRDQEKIDLYCADSPADRTAVLTCNVKGIHAADAAAILDGDFNIAVRAGLHCAPLCHRRLGTLDHGAIRFSIGLFNTEKDIDLAIEAMTEMARLQ